MEKSGEEHEEEWRLHRGIALLIAKEGGGGSSHRQCLLSR